MAKENVELEIGVGMVLRGRFGKKVEMELEMVGLNGASGNGRAPPR